MDQVCSFWLILLISVSCLPIGKLQVNAESVDVNMAEKGSTEWLVILAAVCTTAAAISMACCVCKACKSEGKVFPDVYEAHRNQIRGLIKEEKARPSVNLKHIAKKLYEIGARADSVTETVNSLELRTRYGLSLVRLNSVGGKQAVIREFKKIEEQDSYKDTSLAKKCNSDMQSKSKRTTSLPHSETLSPSSPCSETLSPFSPRSETLSPSSPRSETLSPYSRNVEYLLVPQSAGSCLLDAQPPSRTAERAKSFTDDQSIYLDAHSSLGVIPPHGSEAKLKLSPKGSNDRNANTPRLPAGSNRTNSRKFSLDLDNKDYEGVYYEASSLPSVIIDPQNSDGHVHHLQTMGVDERTVYEVNPFTRSFHMSPAPHYGSPPVITRQKMKVKSRIRKPREKEIQQICVKKSPLNHNIKDPDTREHQVRFVLGKKKVRKSTGTEQHLQ